MKSGIFINSQSPSKAAILRRNRSEYPAKPQQQMELLILILIGFVIVILVLPFVALAKTNNAKRVVDDLVARVSSLENETRSLRGQFIPPVKPETSAPAAEVVLPPLATIAPAPVGPETASEPPPVPRELVELSAPQNARPVKPPIDWEQFMGAKLFAWIGGLALFLGVAFFVKYSFEHNLIPPELRVSIGFAVGASLVTGGLLLKRKENAVTAQTLCCNRHSGALLGDRLHVELTITSRCLVSFQRFC